MEIALRAALIDWLAADPVLAAELNAVAEEAHARTSLPWLAIAASANFPALLLSILWRGFSTFGATVSIITGSVLALGLIIISHTVWMDVFKQPTAIFPLKNPAIISMTGAFVAGWLGSLLRPDERAQAMYGEQKIRNYLGVGAE